MNLKDLNNIALGRSEYFEIKLSILEVLKLDDPLCHELHIHFQEGTLTNSNHLVQ